MPEQNEKVHEGPEQVAAESEYPRSEHAASEQTRSGQMRSDQTQPDQTRPEQTRPEQTRPDQTRPDQTRSTDSGSDAMRSEDSGSGQPRTGQPPAGQPGQQTAGQQTAGQQTAHQAGEQRERLVPEDHAASYGSRWDAVKGTFVDEPREAVAQADALVGELLDELETLFREQRRSIERGLDSDETSTEDLRMALRRYRSFFERLLAV
ncbi:hypothetical protein [Pseudonocardia hierapolitana]|nr:hypothetical protein [Pseudonocardia hierapolitana]